MAPAPNRSHQRILGNLHYLLRRYLEDNPAGEVFLCPFDVFLTEHDVYQPDLLFVGKERSGILVDEGAIGAPTLVVEILSPGSARFDRTAKKAVYVASGVEELWLVDPDRKEVALYRLQENGEHPKAIYGGDDNFSSICFPGLQLRLGQVF